MWVERVYSIAGRGTVAYGIIEQGKISMGDEVSILGLMGEEKRTVVTSVQIFHKNADQGFAGDRVGLLLRGIIEAQLQRG